MPEDLEEVEVITPPEDDGSATDTPPADPTGEADGVTDSGEAQSDGTPETPQSEKYIVKVDGEDVEVTLEEALQGYQRTADYTRKTQALAEKARMADAFEALRDELKANPERVIAALSAQAGLAAGKVPSSTDDGTETEVDPRVTQLEQRIAYLQQVEEDRMLESTLSGLEAKYGDDFDRDEVIQAAVRQGVTDIGGLEQVYKVVQYDRLAARLDAQNDHTAKQAAEEAARVAAAEAAAATVDSGSSVTPSTTAPTSFDNVEDAFEAAIAAVGGGWS